MRPFFFLTGLFTLLFCWVGPLPDLSQHAFYAHMAMHMGVVAVAAALIAVGLAGTRFDPVRKAPRWFAPIPISLLELVVVWAWHAPQLHHFARHHFGGLLAEQGMFLLFGLAIWLSAFGGSIPRTKSRAAAGVIGLLLTSMHMTLLGALLIFAPRPLYDHGHQTAQLDPLTDQQVGGAIMVLVGGVTYLIGGLYLTVDLLRPVSLTLKERSA